MTTRVARSAEEGALIYAMDGDEAGLKNCLEGFHVVELADLSAAIVTLREAIQDELKARYFRGEK